MSKANEPAYPCHYAKGDDRIFNSVDDGYGGLTKREKLAMEIYVRLVSENQFKPWLNDESGLAKCAQTALRAADIFFDELNK